MRFQQRRRVPASAATLLSASVSVAHTMELSVGAAPILGQESGENPQVRMVQGEVVAVNVKDSPNVIVVRVTMAGNKELVVGALVEPKTAISRGAQQVRLEDLKVGESVAVTYLKRPDGLMAHSIQAR